MKCRAVSVPKRMNLRACCLRRLTNPYKTGISRKILLMRPPRFRRFTVATTTGNKSKSDAKRGQRGYRLLKRSVTAAAAAFSAESFSEIGRKCVVGTSASLQPPGTTRQYVVLKATNESILRALQGEAEKPFCTRHLSLTLPTLQQCVWLDQQP